MAVSLMDEGRDDNESAGACDRTGGPRMRLGRLAPGAVGVGDSARAECWLSLCCRCDGRSGALQGLRGHSHRFRIVRSIAALEARACLPHLKGGGPSLTRRRIILPTDSRAALARIALGPRGLDFSD